MPGLLPTQDYARAALSTKAGATEAEVEVGMAERIARQQVLTRDEPSPPRLYALLDEGILYRPAAPAHRGAPPPQPRPPPAPPARRNDPPRPPRRPARPAGPPGAPSPAREARQITSAAVAPAALPPRPERGNFASHGNSAHEIPGKRALSYQIVRSFRANLPRGLISRTCCPEGITGSVVGPSRARQSSPASSRCASGIPAGNSSRLNKRASSTSLSSSFRPPSPPTSTAS